MHLIVMFRCVSSFVVYMVLAECELLPLLVLLRVQVLRNLVSNALKFTLRGGLVKITLVLRVPQRRPLPPPMKPGEFTCSSDAAVTAALYDESGNTPLEAAELSDAAC